MYLICARCKFFQRCYLVKVRLLSLPRPIRVIFFPTISTTPRRKKWGRPRPRAPRLRPRKIPPKSTTTARLTAVHLAVTTRNRLVLWLPQNQPNRTCKNRRRPTSALRRPISGRKRPTNQENSTGRNRTSDPKCQTRSRRCRTRPPKFRTRIKFGAFSKYRKIRNLF